MTAAAVPFGTVIVDYDGETMMSLGFLSDDAPGYEDLACIRLRWSAGTPVDFTAGINRRDVIVSMIGIASDLGTRYAVQGQEP